MITSINTSRLHSDYQLCMLPSFYLVKWEHQALFNEINTMVYRYSTAIFFRSASGISPTTVHAAYYSHVSSFQNVSTLQLLLFDTKAETEEVETDYLQTYHTIISNSSSHVANHITLLFSFSCWPCAISAQFTKDIAITNNRMQSSKKMEVLKKRLVL